MPRRILCRPLPRAHSITVAAGLHAQTQASSAAARASRPIANFVRQVDGIVRRATNAASESVNAKVQRIKRTACGFRSRERFRSAILFKLGGLDLYPAAASATHTTS
ncbi:MAG: transposase [Planctomycetota bacterium]